jgi:formylglycine-generating enzyme required for sulfatase activity
MDAPRAVAPSDRVGAAVIRLLGVAAATGLLLAPLLVSAERIETQDGAPMVRIPAVEFLRGRDDLDKDERPARRLTLDPYLLDVHEVTNERFARFVTASGHRTDAEKEGWAWVWTGKYAKVRGADWRHPKGPQSSLDGLALHPVVQVSYHDAQAYCRWAAKRLPTEAEWEGAARGTDGRRWPWGDTFDRARVNIEGAEDGYPETAPVGSFAPGASPYGVHDLVGNVWEWVADWYAADYYAKAPPRGPRGPTTGKLRGVRGGAWGSPPEWSTTTNRYSRTPDYRNNKIGFRCARDDR